MNGYHIELTDQATQADLDTVELGLAAYNRSKAGHEHWRTLNLFVRDAEERIVGGLLGYSEWNWLHVAVLWLEESLRHGGLGSELMRRAETEALARGCDSVSLDTYDFQAPAFYPKFGYTLFATLDDYPAGHKRFFFRKTLQRSGSGGPVAT